MDSLDDSDFLADFEASCRLTKHLKLESYSATLNMDTVLHEEDDENIYAASFVLSKANDGLVPLTLHAQVQRRVE